MAKSSIHIIPVKKNSEFHNKRLKEYDYVRKDLQHLNESWEAESISQALKRIKKSYEKSTGQRLQKKATPIREGVVNLNVEHTMVDLHKLKDALYEKFRIKTIQIHIHRDEGHIKSKEWKQNLHAHLVFDWTDENGKTLKLHSQNMSEVQDIIAETLEMERGVKSNKKHLSAIGYKIQEIEKEIEILNEKKEEYINLTTSENIENYIEKTFLGKKINEDKLKDLILSEKTKASIIQEIQDNNKKLRQETERIIAEYQEKIESLKKIEVNLEETKNDLKAQKTDYFNKAQHLARQNEELSKYRQIKAEYESIKVKYEKIKHLEGLTNSKEYINESIHIRELYEAKVSKLILIQLTENKIFKDKEELYEAFIDKMKEHGFYEKWSSSPYFEILEADMNIQYARGRGRII